MFRFEQINAGQLCNSRHAGHFPSILPINFNTSPSFNGFLGLSLNDETYLFIVILSDKTVAIMQSGFRMARLLSVHDFCLG